MSYIETFFREIGSVFQDLGIIDFIDFVVVALFFYYILLAIRGTRAVQIVQGIVALLVLYCVSYLLELRTFHYILSGILLSTMIGLPVVFQPELRRALMRLGQQGLPHNPAFYKLGKEEIDDLVDEIAFACVNLSLNNYGALIVIEQENGLAEVIETGQLIKSTISAKLLQTIFFLNTPLHDGAVIIRGNVLEAAACYLPLTESPIDSKFGTRHRAAIGLTEQSDAIVIVVSEETGEIRIAREGRFSAPMTDETKLKTSLIKVLANYMRNSSKKNDVSKFRPLDRFYKVDGTKNAKNNDQLDNTFEASGIDE